MNGYEKRTQMKKELILQATEELIFSKGITNTSVEEIANLAGVSKVTLFKYFGSKDALVRLVFERYMDRKLSEVDKMLQSDLPFQEKIEVFFSMEQITQDSIDDRFLQSVPWEDPAIQCLYDEIANTKAVPMLLELFKQGKDAGVIDQDISIEAFMAYLGAFTGIMKDPNFLKTSEEFKNSISKLFYFGLFGKK
ncbi:TetR/AcrR family transcriptional regulator [Alkaliphilus transvaalensis]|uniref:TetR/AcrR family transcriptional regulator n=1 Tax=Alkaliphilus transvaalensis TaxID=114628 RepID=UPI00047CDF9D|nr:TetR/AcrR family transcriptional regulator [Alkaliphilus transvaalensis]